MNVKKFKKFSPLYRGVTAVTASLLALSTVAYGVAKSDLAVEWVDGYFGVDRTIYNDWVEHVDGYTIPGSFEGYSYLKGKPYETVSETADDYFAELKAHVIKQGEEGFALLKNDNNALPLKTTGGGSNIALFGWNAYNLTSSHTGMSSNRNNSDSITLKAAFDAIEGITVNDTVQSAHFTGAMTGPKYVSGFGADGSGAWKTWEGYTVPEKAPDDTMVGSWNIDKSSTTGIVIFGRGGGEGACYKPDKSPNADDPLALSADELKLVQLAKEKCSKVVVLIVSANSMELGPLVTKGGDYEVDAIGFCGVPNVYQYQGIANVLAGKVNATGGLTDTYVYDNSYNPAVINMGQQQYSDLTTISSFEDPLGRGITATGNGGYYANNYIVEAEGIYVGYKYYETRYFDSFANPTYQASDAAGSSTGNAWNYADEVVFPFGQSLSYIPYTQEITDVKVDLSEHGKVTATVKVTNDSDTEDGYFLTQLYVNRPYTEYDIEHKVEKSAVDFLNSKKVEVKHGESKTVEISLPTRYLASWDSSALNGEGTYVLDEGTYYFTAAAGAHAAANNFLDTLGHDTDETTEIGKVVAWDELKEFDDKTFSVSNGVDVRNQMENADINYFLGDDTVTYLSRNKWKDTFVKNYTDYVNASNIASEAPFTIAGAEKETEWLMELISAQYKVTPSTDESKWAKVEATLPTEVQNGDFATVWAYIMNVATSKPEEFSDINSEQWQNVAKAINLNVAIGNIPGGGGSTQTWYGIDNPSSKQSESVHGYQQSLTLGDSSKRNMNVGSNTLLGSSFNPDLAYEWGLIEGEGGLWLQKQGVGDGNAMTVWGAGLNQHRTPYNGRNSEYVSEDPMLTNRIGEAQMRGLVQMGSICGPKHMGFNDQEHNREGNACYMTEQKVRETDTRCYEGALRVDEANGTGVMMSFARIGATNCTNSVGYIKNIMRGEWGFTGIISTDMGKGAGYHEPGALIMATVNEYAGSGNAWIGTGPTDFSDEAYYSGRRVSFPHLTLGNARKDLVFAEQSRQTSLYELFTIARSGSGVYVERRENMGEDIVVEPYDIPHHDPIGSIDKAGWENIFIALEAVFGVLTAAAAIAWIASIAIPSKEEN